MQEPLRYEDPPHQVGKKHSVSKTSNFQSLSVGLSKREDPVLGSSSTAESIADFRTNHLANAGARITTEQPRPQAYVEDMSSNLGHRPLKTCSRNGPRHCEPLAFFRATDRENETQGCLFCRGKDRANNASVHRWLGQVRSQIGKSVLPEYPELVSANLPDCLTDEDYQRGKHGRHVR